MSAPASSLPATAFEWGRHDVPLIEPVGFWIMPQSPECQSYRVVIQLTGPEPSRPVYQELLTNTVGETAEVVARLRERGIRWDARLQSVKPSLENHTIEIQFQPVETSEIQGKFWGRMFSTFHRSLGFSTGSILCEHDTDVVTLTCPKGKSQMEEAISNLHQISFGDPMLPREEREEIAESPWNVGLDIRKTWQEKASDSDTMETQGHTIFRFTQGSMQLSTYKKGQRLVLGDPNLMFGALIS